MRIEGRPIGDVFNRRYAVDKESGDALLGWLQPYEDFAYRKKGHWKDLAKCNKLTKSMLPKADKPYNQDLIDAMVLLIKEELHHFYQVLEMMADYGIEYQNISSSRYAKGMLKHAINHEPDALVDKLICGAYIVAAPVSGLPNWHRIWTKRCLIFTFRYCAPRPGHFQDYLKLAQQIAGSNIDHRVRYFGEIEAQLILSNDDNFKFHSGIPIAA